MTSERDTRRLKAHWALHTALRSGRIVKPKRCQECGKKPPPFLLRAHHADHSSPLDVEWLCSKCHGKRNLEAYLCGMFAADDWTRIVQKAKREGVSLRALILGWCKEWVDKP